VIEPHPSDWLKGLAWAAPEQGVAGRACGRLLAVKPQMMGRRCRAAGSGERRHAVRLDRRRHADRSFEAVLGAGTPIVRTMPNTPAMVGRGITAIIGNAHRDRCDMALAEAFLMAAVGQVVRLDGEDQIDAVTAVSGSGPAYVFHLIEAMAAAGEAEGLPPMWPCNWPAPRSAGRASWRIAKPKRRATADQRDLARWHDGGGAGRADGPRRGLPGASAPRRERLPPTAGGSLGK
jgi:hypothetical protein